MADVAGTKDAAEKTEFAKRNPHLEKLVPDCIENAVDKLLPDALEKVKIDRVRQLLACFALCSACSSARRRDRGWRCCDSGG
jgi:hypothetical protein